MTIKYSIGEKQPDTQFRVQTDMLAKSKTKRKHFRLETPDSSVSSAAVCRNSTDPTEPLHQNSELKRTFLRTSASPKQHAEALRSHFRFAQKIHTVHTWSYFRSTTLLSVLCIPLTQTRGIRRRVSTSFHRPKLELIFL